MRTVAFSNVVSATSTTTVDYYSVYVRLAPILLLCLTAKCNYKFTICFLHIVITSLNSICLDVILCLMVVDVKLYLRARHACLSA